MVLKVVLQIKAVGENVKTLQPSKDFNWNVKLTSRDPTNFKDETPKQTTKNFIKISQSKWIKSTVPGKKNELVNHNQKLAFDNTSVAVVKDRLGVYEFDENIDSALDSDETEESNSDILSSGWQTICVFKCDNCEIVDFEVNCSGWMVESSNGTIFENCEVEDSEWYDVDSSEDLVSITGLKWRFSKKSVGFEDESKYLIHYIENCLHIADHHNRDE